MKINLFSFRNKFFNAELEPERRALELLNAHSVYVDSFSVLSPSDEDGFLKSFSSLKSEATFILNTSECRFNYEEALESVGVKLTDGVFGGDCFVAVLPDDLSDQSFEKVFAALENYFGVYHDKTVFKLFGLEKEQIEKITDDISSKYPSAFFYTETVNLDSRTVLIYDNRAPKIEVDRAIKEFLYAFSANVYAEDDVSVEKRINELLRLRGRRISTAESMTGGAISAKIVSVEGASDLFYEGLVTYNTNAKEERLNVVHRTVQTYGVVSSEVAYEMAKGILETRRVNSAISITGYAGATRDDSGKPEGLCYIGIGLDDEVKVYKYTFRGTRKEIIDCASNAALFLMIKSIINV